MWTPSLECVRTAVRKPLVGTARATSCAAPPEEVCVSECECEYAYIHVHREREREREREIDTHTHTHTHTQHTHTHTHTHTGEIFARGPQRHS